MYYIMAVRFNPKDASSFASVSLDRSIKVVFLPKFGAVAERVRSAAGRGAEGRGAGTAEQGDILGCVGRRSLDGSWAGAK